MISKNLLVPLLFLFATVFSLQAGSLPPTIYVLDFDASNALVQLGQDQTVDKLFTDIAAMTLSNQLVMQLSKNVAPAQRITSKDQAKAPGWLITGSFQSITLKDTGAVTGLYKIQATAVLTDLADPTKTLATFPADSTYYKGNESLDDAEGNGGADGPPSHKSPGDKLARGLAIDSQRAAKRIVELLKEWMAGK